MSDNFTFDVFLSHSSKDKAVVGPLAERLRQDGVKVWFDEWGIKSGYNIPAKREEELHHSRVPALWMSTNVFGSNWAQLESGTVRFRDPLNKARRFLPLRLDEGSKVEIAAELVHELDPDGKQLCVVKLTDYTAEKVRTLCTDPDELHGRRAHASRRSYIFTHART